MSELAVRQTNLQSDSPKNSISPLFPAPPPPPAPEAPFIYPRQQQSVVLSHWYALVPNFNTSTHEFYAALNKELEDRKIPGLSVNRTEYAEGGILSGQRQYLHLARERLTFDICAAPFGTSYFFSCRLSEITPTLRLWKILVLVFALGAVWWSMSQWLGMQHGSIVVGLVIVLGMFAVIVARDNFDQDFDRWLLNSPMLGGLYLALLRKDTYYREDTRLMYLESVNAIAKELVQHVTGANGIHLTCFKEHSPILSELYKPTSVPVAAAPKPA